MKHKKQNIDPKLKRKIDLYVNGELDNKQVDKLWAELVHDSRALGYLKSVIAISDIDNEEYVARIKSTTQNRTKNYWRLSAALILIAGALFIFHISGETTTSVQPITSIALNYYRSADSVSDSGAISSEAVKLVVQGKDDMAVRIIDVELSQTDDVHTKSLLLIQSGSILYNAGKYRSALFRFDRVTKIPGIDLLIREKADWYLGNTYLQLGELQAAKVAFQNTYKLDGAYRRVVEKYLTALREI